MHFLFQKILSCTNRIMANGRIIVCRQLVLPVAVTVDLRDRLQRRPGIYIRGIRIAHLAQDVLATVVVVHPGRARVT